MSTMPSAPSISGTGDDTELVRDMGYTEAEWLRVLPAALGSWPWQREGQRVLAQASGGGTLELTWSALPPRRLGLAAIPRLAVVFRTQGIASQEFAVWLARFDLYTRRGGG
jgi:hypothetical protein